MIINGVDISSEQFKLLRYLAERWYAGRHNQRLCTVGNYGFHVHTVHAVMEAGFCRWQESEFGPAHKYIRLTEKGCAFVEMPQFRLLATTTEEEE